MSACDRFCLPSRSSSALCCPTALASLSSLLALLCSTAGLLSASCNKGDADAVAPPDPAAFCAALQAAFVDRDVTCSAGSRLVLEALSQAEWLCESVRQAAANGTVTYDQREAGACLDWLKALPCGRSLVPPHSAGPCDRALAGTKNEGESCWILNAELELSDCAAPGDCEVRDVCPGTCRPAQRAGEPCDANQRCARGTFCASATPADPPRCHVVAAAGAACIPGVEGKDVFRPSGVNACEDGYHCAEPAHVCVADAPEDPCMRGERLCAGGVCALEPSDSAAAGVRAVCRKFVEPGQACVATADAVIVVDGVTTQGCGPGAACLYGQCVAGAPPGAACTGGYCADSGPCPASNVCPALAATSPWGYRCLGETACGYQGEPCCLLRQTGITCAAGLTCDFARLVCTAH